MKFLSKAAATTALAATAFAVSSVANADAISDRQAKMKTVGKSIGIVGKMAKGQSDFDAAIALQAFVDMKNAAQGFEALFPDGSGEGKTEAAPAIFTDRAGFEAKQVDFVAALDKVTVAAPADLKALQASLRDVGANCGACHKAYRVKKN
ncbi:MAG: cytochrome c [Pseudomonadota bacterium]